MPWNVGTSSTHVDVQDTVKHFLPKERKNKRPAATEGKKPIGLTLLNWQATKIQIKSKKSIRNQIYQAMSWKYFDYSVLKKYAMNPQSIS